MAFGADFGASGAHFWGSWAHFLDLWGSLWSFGLTLRVSWRFLGASGPRFEVLGGAKIQFFQQYGQYSKNIEQPLVFYSFGRFWGGLGQALGGLGPDF